MSRSKGPPNPAKVEKKNNGPFRRDNKQSHQNTSVVLLIVPHPGLPKPTKSTKVGHGGAYNPNFEKTP